MAVHTHYDTLQVSSTASVEVIRASYQALMQKWQPDSPEDKAGFAQVALQLHDAHAVLSNPEHRAEYDRLLLAASQSAAADTSSQEHVGAMPMTRAEVTNPALPSLASSKSSRESQTEPKKIDGPHGVGGWLALLVFGMLVLGPLTALGRTAISFASAENEYSALAQNSKWASFMAVEWIVVLTICTLSIFGGYGLATKRTFDAVSRAKGVLWINFAMNIVATVIIPGAMYPSPSTEDWASSVVPSLFAVAIWTAYLNRSIRVKNTYSIKTSTA